MTEDEAKKLNSCLVLVEWNQTKKRSWIHCAWQEEGSEGPTWCGENVVTSYEHEGWLEHVDGDRIDDYPCRVLAFAPLPEIL